MRDPRRPAGLFHRRHRRHHAAQERRHGARDSVKFSLRFLNETCSPPQLDSAERSCRRSRTGDPAERRAVRRRSSTTSPGRQRRIVLLYTLSGAPREAFEQFGQPRERRRCSGRRSAGEAPSASTTCQDPRYGTIGAAPRHAEGTPAGTELPGGAGGLAVAGGDRRAVLRAPRARRVHRAGRAPHRRRRGAGRCRHRQRAPLRGGQTAAAERERLLESERAARAEAERISADEG